MKLIAIPTRDSMVDDHFGHCAYYAVHGIAVIRGCQGKVDDVLNAYLNGELKDSLESCDHHDCDHHQEKLCANRAPSSSLEMAEVQPKVFKPVYVVPSFSK